MTDPDRDSAPAALQRSFVDEAGYRRWVADWRLRRMLEIERDRLDRERDRTNRETLRFVLTTIAVAVMAACVALLLFKTVLEPPSWRAPLPPRGHAMEPRRSPATRSSP